MQSVIKFLSLRQKLQKKKIYSHGQVADEYQEIQRQNEARLCDSGKLLTLKNLSLQQLLYRPNQVLIGSPGHLARKGMVPAVVTKGR